MSDTPAGGEQLDEAAIARAVSIGLPVVTVLAAAAVGFLMGPATAILVLAAGLLLGVIAILWGSIRILSGDAPLPADLAELDLRAEGGDPLLARKKMLLRALKDLENERAIGKLEADDYEPIAARYRAELKGVLTKIDEALAPNRALAEEAARKYLEKAAKKDASGEEALVDERVVCPKCDAKNEADAKFCKECATKLGAETAKASAEENEDA